MVSFPTAVAAALYHVVPNIGPFRVVDGLQAASQETTVTAEYLGYVTVYALLLIAGIIALAVALFQKREVG